MKHFSCALSGHRDLPETFNCAALYDKIEELIRKGCNYFYCGMAEGFDLLSLDCLLSLKQSYDVSIEACVPFPGQENRYGEKEKSFYRRAIPLCDKTTILCPRYQEGCFHLRNRYMIDSADILLAYCKKKSGGTFYTVNYAMESGKLTYLLV